MTIWKFPFDATDRVAIEMPAGARVLCVQTQRGAFSDGVAALWALVDPEAPKERRSFRIYGTGQSIDGDPGEYVGTFQWPGLVFHLFEDGAA